MKSFKQFLAEKTIGLIEPITLYFERGFTVGNYQAKIDSGNDGYNVLDAQDIKVSGNKVKFKTNGKELELKVVEFLNVHIGDNNVEERPVVIFDVEFNGKQHKDVRFSLANREMNDQKVLISKDFIKQLKLLIDVTK